MKRNPIITRWSKPGDRFAGFMAVKLEGSRELVVAEYSERAQVRLIEEYERYQANALKNRPELIEGDLVAPSETANRPVTHVARVVNEQQ